MDPIRIRSMAERNLHRLRDLSDRLRADQSCLHEYLTEIEGRFEGKEPWIKAFLPEKNRFERLRREIVKLECRFPDPIRRPSLYGILVGVKDIFHVEGFPTFAGSQLPPDVLWGPEAESVRLLKSAGALILGKTVTTEFAHTTPGPTRNPHCLDHTPGGSSSGSAASVAAGLCPLSLGTQTGGSILRPAAYCGIVGFKPTYGRISTAGVIPLAPSLDHVGYFTGDVDGAIMVAAILCKDWKRVNDVPKLTCAVPEGPYLEHASKEGLGHFLHTCDLLSDSGIEIRSVPMLKDFEDILELTTLLNAAEAAEVHGLWFRDYSERYHEKTADLIKKGKAVNSEALDRCRNSRLMLRNTISQIMQSENVSAILSPAAVGPAPAGLESTGDSIMNRPWTHAGLPAISIPSGRSEEGLPMGLQIVGPWLGDEMLLELARLVSDYLV